MPTHRPGRACWRASLLVASVVGIVAGASGCQGAASGADSESRSAAYGSSAGPTTGPVTRIEFAVRDFSLRPLDSACAAARPFLDLRPGATVVVRDGTGTERARTTLPEGRAIKATDIDFETARREPTFCLFAIDLVPELAPGTYELLAGDGRVMALTVGEGAGPATVSFPSVGSPEDVLGGSTVTTPSSAP